MIGGECGKREDRIVVFTKPTFNGTFSFRCGVKGPRHFRGGEKWGNLHPLGNCGLDSFARCDNDVRFMRDGVGSRCCC